MVCLGASKYRALRWDDVIYAVPLSTDCCAAKLVMIQPSRPMSTEQGLANSAQL